MDPEQSRGSDSPRNPGFCEKCSVAVFDDGADEFFEGTTNINEPTLQHSREGLNDDEPDMLNEFLREWVDVLPDLPVMAASSRAGCRMCDFVREALLRRNVSCEGVVLIFGTYQWGGRACMKGFLPYYGLAFWKCVVIEPDTWTDVAVLDFDVVTSNSKLTCRFYFASQNFISDSNSSAQDDLLQWLGLGKKCAPEPLNPDNVEWLKSKLRSCDEECVHPKPALPFLPTRLIDVGQSEENVPRLVVVQDMLKMNSFTMDDLKYAALTYCWGPKEDAMKQVKTTKDTISANYQGMPLSSLSPVVRDTIKVCRALEIRYLWVDALCIIQADKADFHRESQTMGKIYNSCVVAICPLSSQSCLQGYLGARPEGLDMDFQSSRHKHIRGTYRLVPHSTDVDRGELPWCVSDQSLHLDIERSSWYRRGWTFQELILSPRFVFFGPSMSHFLCDTRAFSENGQIRNDINLRAGLRVGLDVRSTINKAFGEGFDEMDRSVNGIRQIYQRDWKGVREVSTKDWTYREDILAGAAGLAQAFATITGDTYLAGLWKSDLQHQLVWYMKEPFPGDLASLVDSLQNVDPYVAPSWSWASRRTSVVELPDRAFPISGALKEVVSATGDDFDWLLNHIRPEFVLIDYHMGLQGSSPFLSLNGSFLRFKGRMCRFPQHEPASGPNSGTSWGRFSGGIGTCFFDWRVGETSVQSTLDSTQLLLVSSCCSPTLDWKEMGRRAGYDDEDINDWMPSDAGVGGLSFSDDYESVFIEKCRFCADPMHKRAGWGLVVHPAEKSGSYVRVGAFVFFPHKGGMDLFSEEEEIVLI